MIGKLPYFDWWDVTPATITLAGEGMNEDGVPNQAIEWSGNVNFSEKARRIQNADGLWVNLSGVVHVKGDILPGVISKTGTVQIKGYEQSFTIISINRPRNPDGTVNHTRIEVI